MYPAFACSRLAWKFSYPMPEEVIMPIVVRIVLTTTTTTTITILLLDKTGIYSSMSSIVRVVCYCLPTALIRTVLGCSSDPPPSPPPPRTKNKQQSAILTTTTSAPEQTQRWLPVLHCQTTSPIRGPVLNLLHRPTRHRAT